MRSINQTFILVCSLATFFLSPPSVANESANRGGFSITCASPATPATDRTFTIDGLGTDRVRAYHRFTDPVRGAIVEIPYKPEAMSLLRASDVTMNERDHFVVINRWASAWEKIDFGGPIPYDIVATLRIDGTSVSEFAVTKHKATGSIISEEYLLNCRFQP